MLLLGCSAAAASEDNRAGFEPSETYTSRDLLQRSDEEQRIWLSGAAVGLANGVGLIDSAAGSCIARWYFDGTDQAYFDTVANMEEFPDFTPAVIMIALARRACPEAEILRR